MAGQIIKRGTRRYIVRIFDRYHENGKRRYLNKLIHGTRKDAQDYLNQALTAKDLRAFVKPPPSSITVSAYLDKWLESARTRVSRRTGDGYAALLKRYIREPLGKCQLDSLRRMDIQTVYDAMRKRGLSARVVRHTNAVLHNALTCAAQEVPPMISGNPCDLVKLPQLPHTERRVLSPDQAVAFVEAADVMPRGLLFEFALLTGMRPEEYLALKWPDLDFERCTAMVQRALIRHKKFWSFEEPKTKASRRKISLSSPLVRKLAAHKRSQAEQRLKAGAKWQANDLVFCAKTGMPLSIPNITYQYFRPLLAKAKLPHMRLYDLRHSHATLLLIAGEHPKVVSERLGHASVVITLDTYTHVLASMQERTATLLEKMFYAESRSEAARRK